MAREVLRAEPATAPLDIVLLVDDSQAATRAIPYLRDALPKFVERLEGKASIGLVTLGERPTSVVERTKDIAALKKGFSRIFARPGSGAYLLEAISEVSRGFRTRDAERPVIVALTVEGIEFSNLQYQQVLEELRASGAQLHVLAIGSPAPMSSDEIRNKSLVIAEGTEKTGGRREQLLSEMGIADTLDELADELLNQYRVTYGRPDALVPPDEVDVTRRRSRASPPAPGRGCPTHGAGRDAHPPGRDCRRLPGSGARRAAAAAGAEAPVGRRARVAERVGRRRRRQVRHGPDAGRLRGLRGRRACRR